MSNCKLVNNQNFKLNRFLFSQPGTDRCRNGRPGSLILFFLLLLYFSPAQSEIVYGHARVSDADTISIRGERIRFTGIDAPETKQYCRRSTGEPYRCGQAATQALIERIYGLPVKCDLQEDRDRYNRRLGTCYFSDGVNMSAWLVKNGHAVAARKYSDRYVLEEHIARAARRGIWAGRFMPPWKWRQGHRLP